MPAGRPASLSEPLPTFTPLVRLRPAVRTLEPSAWSSTPRNRKGGPRRTRRLAAVAVAALLLLAALLLVRGAGNRHGVTQTVPAPPLGNAATALVAGDATFYAAGFDGQTMADGATFNMDDPSVTAANRWTLGTRLCVRRVPGGPWDATLSPSQRATYFGRTIEVTVEDRGAFTHALDLSRGAFAELGRLDEGVVRVAVAPAPDQSASGSCSSA